MANVVAVATGITKCSSLFPLRAWEDWEAGITLTKSHILMS